MAHLRSRLDTEPSATMFSPSVARIAAAEARDWSFVDSWLASQFASRPPPPFERNADTLKALHALIAFNDTASEEARLLSRIDREAPEEPSASPTLAVMRDSLLDMIEQELPKEGKVALNALASMALSAKVALPEPERLGAAIIDTQAAIFEVEQMASRAAALEQHIRSEMVHAADALAALQNESYQLPDGLGKRNVELQRAVKAMVAQVPKFEKSIAATRTSAPVSDLTIHDILREEQNYLALIESRKELEKRISVFRGLPSDPDLARNELNAYRKELQGITSRRDAAFQGLVERETPVKRR